MPQAIPPYTTASSALRQEVDRIVRKRYGKRPDAQIAIGVIRGGREEIWHYGPRGENADNEPPVYEIGSITKVMTASLLAVMADEGTVKPQDPAAKYLAGLADHPVMRTVTLEQLATHHSGLPRLPANINATVTDRLNPYANYREAELLHYLQTLTPPKKAPAFLYSNLGAGLLGHLLSVAAGLPLEQLMEQKLFRPLGMSDTSLIMDENHPLSTRLAPVYNEKGKPVKHWDLGVLAGAGAARSTAPDLLRFLRANLMPDGELGRILASCHAARRQVSPQMSIGLGWMISNRKEHTVHWHNGGTYGSTSFAGFNRRTGDGAVVLTNHGVGFLTQLAASFGLAKMTVDDIGFRLLERDGGS